MIKEFAENKINNYLDKIVEMISMYFGSECKKSILDNGKNIKIALIKGKGVVEIGDNQVYLDDDPVCIKEDNESHILIPLNLLVDKQGNVVFLHVLLHALCDDCLKEKYDDLNEVLIDYIANDIAKLLEKRKLNITLESDVSYESNSFYSQFFYLIEDFYLDNKIELLKVLSKGDNLDIKDIDKMAKLIERCVNDVLFTDIEEIEVNKFKR